MQNKEISKVAIVSHNACILFYLLKFCNLDSAIIPKKLTISYNGKILINNSIMALPSIIELKIKNNKILDINYYDEI